MYWKSFSKDRNFVPLSLNRYDSQSWTRCTDSMIWRHIIPILQNWIASLCPISFCIYISMYIHAQNTTNDFHTLSMICPVRNMAELKFVCKSCKTSVASRNIKSTAGSWLETTFAGADTWNDLGLGVNYWQMKHASDSCSMNRFSQNSLPLVLSSRLSLIVSKGLCNRIDFVLVQFSYNIKMSFTIHPI